MSKLMRRDLRPSVCQAVGSFPAKLAAWWDGIQNDISGRAGRTGQQERGFYRLKVEARRDGTG